MPTVNRELQKAYTREILDRNKAYIAEVRARTFCEKCGKQPIEWHRDEHVQAPRFRLSKLGSQRFSIERIQQEIDACQALCRRCHMIVDGRMEKLIARQRAKRIIVFCSRCKSAATPSRRGMCGACYNRWQDASRGFMACIYCTRTQRTATLTQGMCGTCYRKWLNGSIQAMR